MNTRVAAAALIQTPARQEPMHASNTAAANGSATTITRQRQAHGDARTRPVLGHAATRSRRLAPEPAEPRRGPVPTAAAREWRRRPGPRRSATTAGRAPAAGDATVAPEAAAPAAGWTTPGPAARTARPAPAASRPPPRPPPERTPRVADTANPPACPDRSAWSFVRSAAEAPAAARSRSMRKPAGRRSRAKLTWLRPTLRSPPPRRRRAPASMQTRRAAPIRSAEQRRE